MKKKHVARVVVMKKVLKFVKGKKEEKRECGGMTPSQSGDLISPAQTPDEEKFLGLEDSSGYIVDFCGKDKSLTKLHKAAWQGNLDKLKSALRKVEVDAVDRHNRTALHFAVARGHPNIVWFLLGNNAKTSICDDEGHTPLHKAIERGHKECMTLLLDRGADVNAADYTGNTGLHVAVGRASLDDTSALLKKGADPEVGNNAGDYPLHIATRSENKDLVDLLLGAGASVDVLDRENRTPLMLAAKTGNCLLVRLFVERGAQSGVVDSNGWTARDYAMLGGHETVVVALSKNDLRNSARKPTEDEDDGSREESHAETSEKESSERKMTESVDVCQEGKAGAKEKNEDLTDSPDAEAIPPYCQPPRSWEMIQAGMIDEKSGSEPKRRSITTLGTLRSRRESFTEASATSPKFTLSLNRRKGAKENNAFAKHRFSFNEEESLKCYVSEENTIRKDLEKIELENMLNLEGVERRSTSESDWDITSAESWRPPPASEEEDSGDGTFGRKGTMLEVQEMWVTQSRPTPDEGSGERELNSWDFEEGGPEKEKSFPPPPSALELGVDMAKSIRYMKGFSVDQPSAGGVDRNLWKTGHESHSLDCQEDHDSPEAFKGTGEGAGLAQYPAWAQRNERTSNCQKRDKFADVSRRINEQLQCYDEALRELAESSRQNYFSLPSKSGSRGERKRTGSRDASFSVDGGPHSLPPSVSQWSLENNEKLGPEAALRTPPESVVLAVTQAGEKLEKKTKRHMLLAMRDIKHAVHVTSSFKTSLDDQILSPLSRPEDGFDLGDATSPGGPSGSSGDNSPADENPFFGMGRQETVLEKEGVERFSSNSEEESTVWLQDDAPKKTDSDDDVSELAEDEGSRHRRTSSFSPLGVIHREMEAESHRNGASSRGASPPEVFFGGENEELAAEQSPDVSLSSGPIEPIGTQKDSGSEPESSHNDNSPINNYSLANQHEWLKSNLKAATSEKNKLEELTARLSEKAERLQYELADAKEAAKSRDEVIQLLQGQLTRMEAAYTKSLEESVQSRLQLTSHEQEILHLKELCYKYEEEKEAAASNDAGEFLQELQSKIKTLEDEKERMRKEITHLEEEKSLLEKRLEEERKGGSEVIDECRRWKERCGKLEERLKGSESRHVDYESFAREKEEEYFRRVKRLQQENFEFEEKLMRVTQENIELRAKVEKLGSEVEKERKKNSDAKIESRESVVELKKKNLEMETHLRNLEKEMEENMVSKLKEKEEVVRELMKQFEIERDSLVAGYEKKLNEGRSESDWRTESQKPEMVNDLQDHMGRASQNRGRSSSFQDTKADPLGFGTLLMENVRLNRELNELRMKIAREEKREELSLENAKVKSEIRELKSQVSSIRMLVDGELPENPKSEEKRRSVGKEDEMAWSSLYGMKVGRGRRGGRSASVVETSTGNREVEESSDEGIGGTKRPRTLEETVMNRLTSAANQEANELRKGHEFEFFQLKQEVLSLRSKMSNEKNLRHALENEMIKLRVNLNEKENLEKKMDSLRKRVDGGSSIRSERELLEYEKDLQTKREAYLRRDEMKLADDAFKSKCQVLAKEREKSNELRKSFARKSKSFGQPPLEVSRSHTEPLLPPRFRPLDHRLKNQLEHQLDDTIRKYARESPSVHSLSNRQIRLFNKNCF